MKLLIINYEFPPLGGGGGVACYQLAKELAKDHQVDYLTTGYKGLPKFEVVDMINVYRVPVLGRKDMSTATLLSMLLFVPSSIFIGIKLCRKNRYDIINAHFVVPSGPTGVLLSKLFRIPIITSVYGGDIYDSSKRLSPHRYFLARTLISWLLNSSNGIIAESNNIKGLTKKYYKPKKNIEVIPVGFREPIFNPLTREELNLSSKDLIIVSVGRLIKRKGFDQAIRAVAELPYENIKYLIIGDGPEETDLKNLVKQLNVQDKVELLGYQPESKKFQYMANADIYLLSSLHEGLGICLMEAMYSGLPIVATDNGGQTDLLQEGRNALFAPTMNAEALAEKLNTMIKNRFIIKEMSNNNRADIIPYSISNIAKRYETMILSYTLNMRTLDEIKKRR